MFNLVEIFNNPLGGFKWESPMPSKYIELLYEKISHVIHDKYGISLNYHLDSVNGNLVCRFSFANKGMSGDMITYVRVNDEVLSLLRCGWH